MNQASNREEDTVHQTCRIKQVRCIHWGWVRYSHRSTSTAINVDPTQWYRRYSSHCSNQDLDSCSAFVLLWATQPILIVSAPLASPPCSVFHSSAGINWCQEASQQHGASHQRWAATHIQLGGNCEAQVGKARESCADAGIPQGKTKEELLSRRNALYRWLVSSRERFAAHN